MTDVELDERVTALEENTGGGTENGKGNLCKICNVTCQRFLLELEGKSETLNFLYFRHYRFPHGIDILLKYLSRLSRFV